MRHTVHLAIDDIASAIRSTGRLLALTPFPVTEITVSRGTGASSARLTAVVDAPADHPVSEALHRAAVRAGLVPRRIERPRAPDPTTPFHWQADGAGDDRAG